MPGASGSERRPRRGHRPHLDPHARARRRHWDDLRPAAGPALDPDDRFVAAAARVPGTAAAAHRPLLEALATAPISGMGRIPYSSNATFLLELAAADPLADGRPLRAVYKPARGERPLWDFPHRTLHFREVASYLVDCALGFGLVPPTTLRDGPLGPGSVQRFVPGTAQPRLVDRDRLAIRLAVLAAFDALVNNADRKSAHILVDEGGDVVAIDHGLTFLPYPRQRTVLIDLGGTRLVEEAERAVRHLGNDAARRAALRADLCALLEPVEVEAFEARLEELAEDPVLPVLDPWDGRPFEWW
jgi:hypothetical protein